LKAASDEANETKRSKGKMKKKKGMDEMVLKDFLLGDN
jgi:hypothetical protein